MGSLGVAAAWMRQLRGRKVVPTCPWPGHVRPRGVLTLYGGGPAGSETRLYVTCVGSPLCAATQVPHPATNGCCGRRDLFSQREEQSILIMKDNLDSLATHHGTAVFPINLVLLLKGSLQQSFSGTGKKSLLSDTLQLQGGNKSEGHVKCVKRGNKS